MFEALASLIKSSPLTVWNSLGVWEKDGAFKKKEERVVKSRVYASMLLRIVREATAGGLSPHLFMEQTGKDEWAKRQFSGLKFSLIWPFVCKGIAVPNPKFVRPKHDPFLELADFVCYVIARYVFSIAEYAKGRSTEVIIQPSALGEVRYLGFDHLGSSLWTTSTGYPTSELFRGTEWEAFGGRV